MYIEKNKNKIHNLYIIVLVVPIIIIIVVLLLVRNTSCSQGIILYYNEFWYFGIESTETGYVKTIKQKMLYVLFTCHPIYCRSSTRKIFYSWPNNSSIMLYNVAQKFSLTKPILKKITTTIILLILKHIYMYHYIVAYIYYTNERHYKVNRICVFSIIQYKHDISKKNI